VDSAAYRGFQVVPFNIVQYNVFAGENRGPNIFGTEPWWYYLLNLALYFNVVAIAAFLSLPLAVLPFRFRTFLTNIAGFVDCF
jgi:alpha-1,2-mannosyltransferase